MSLPDEILIRQQGSTREKQLEDTCLMLVGVDPTDKKTPRFLPIGPNGLKVDVTVTTESLPAHDSVTAEMYGSTNNIHYVRYRVGGANGTIVATRTISYVGGGATDNDVFLSSVLTIP